MCGFYITNNSISEEVFSERLDRIKFRGPDFTGIAAEDGIWFGHHRLSILDLDERSNQPMSLDDLVLCYNGEIYNYIEIRDELISRGIVFNTDGDSEVILRSFQLWGTAMADKFNGMFSIVIYSKTSKNLYLIRDRLGVKPLYYSIDNLKFEIASQAQAIKDGKIIDKESVTKFLQLGYLPSPYTIYKYVYKLKPGHCLEYNTLSGDIVEKCYWSPVNFNKQNGPILKSKNGLIKLLQNAVKIRLRSDVEFGTFLSGGVDSSIVTYLASQEVTKPMQIFNIGFKDKIFDESARAQIIASSLNSNFISKDFDVDLLKDRIELLIRVFGEPFADNSALPMMLLSEISSADVKVALTGDGGDEAFMGYKFYDWIFVYNIIKRVPLFFRRLLIKLIPKKYTRLRELVISESDNDLLRKIFTGFSMFSSYENSAWILGYISDINGSVYEKANILNLRMWLEGDSNVKTDRVSMFNGLELRSPFLDYRVLEYGLSMSRKKKYWLTNKKRLLHAVFKDCFPKIQKEINKRGFSIPLKKWLSIEMKGEVLGLFQDDQLMLFNFVDRQKVHELLNRYYINGENLSIDIWRLFILAKWLKSEVN